MGNEPQGYKGWDGILGGKAGQFESGMKRLKGEVGVGGTGTGRSVRPNAAAFKNIETPSCEESPSWAHYASYNHCGSIANPFSTLLLVREMVKAPNKLSQYNTIQVSTGRGYTIG
ncbi:hypothetical protein BS47DRAFT_253282 [Hydnum rufescens UP504]|uniref:Uncharacterized protein n=1 Tax=Hydnum rufescens UP504 TaxID=1448309 RepID=A0A9P6ALS2_9AGAM|nr:hypothetical protein BS47DRAFT_253282 [Hydnum rufescens UP504]